MTLFRLVLQGGLCALAWFVCLDTVMSNVPGVWVLFWIFNLLLFGVYVACALILVALRFCFCSRRGFTFDVLLYIFVD